MGCDIHLFVEYKRYDNWYNFGEKFRLDRDYLMFGMMCEGVRTSPDFCFKEKGLPDNIGYATKDANRLIISDNDTSAEGYCSLLDAKRWGGKIEYFNDKPFSVEHPDWHSHSWLTNGELQLIFDNYGKEKDYDYGEPSPDYYAVKAILNTFEEKGLETRLVFWFDN